MNTSRIKSESRFAVSASKQPAQRNQSQARDRQAEADLLRIRDAVRSCVKDRILHFDFFGLWQGVL